MYEYDVADNKYLVKILIGKKYLFNKDLVLFYTIQKLCFNY